MLPQRVLSGRVDQSPRERRTEPEERPLSDSVVSMTSRNTGLMRRGLLGLLPVLASLGFGCGGSGTTASTGSGGGGGGATTGTGTGGTMMMAGSIPAAGPGNQVDQDFTEVEPNDTPETATPLGAAMNAGVNVWVTSNKLGGATDAADYFVFESGPAAGALTLNICFSAPITEMTATLWKVVDKAAQMPAIGTWTSTGTCVQGPAMGVPMDASTEYLLGLTAKGDASTYNA